MRPKISIIGLGRLGTPVSAIFAARGFEVIGYDPIPERVAAVGEHRSLVFEPGLEEVFAQVGDRLTVTSTLDAAVLASDISFLIVPTPSGPDGSFSIEHVRQTCREVGTALAAKEGYHLVVLASSVMPGSTERQVRVTLEEASGKKIGPDLGLCYTAAFVSLGNLVEGFQRPDMALIGECDERAGDMLEALYEQVFENDPPVARMSPFNAELTKLAMNVLVATRVSIANVLARICEQMPGGNVDVVTRALQLDPRIGKGGLCGAVSYGGPFLARDNNAFGSLMRRLEVARELEGSLGRFNRAQVPWLADFVQERLVSGGSVGVLGLAYKPGTDVIEASPSIFFCRRLSEQGVPVTVHDPAAMDAARRALPSTVVFADSAEACIAASDLVVLLTPWGVYTDLPPSAWARDGDVPRTVVDCWRVVSSLAEQPGVKYVSLGTGPGTVPESNDTILNV